MLAAACQASQDLSLPSSTDGLVERFNQTLRHMVKKVIIEDGQNWNLLLPYVLFAVQESPQASMGFMPFELLFDWWPGGLLDTVRESWEEQPSFFSLVNYIQEKVD